MNSDRVDATDSTIELTRLALAAPELLREAAFIDGEWVTVPERLIVLNPATQRPLGSVPRLTSSHATRAVEAAHRALPGWRKRTAKERSVLLRRWFDLVNHHAIDLARIMTAEQGKPLAEARAEIAYAASFIEWFAEEAKRVYGDTIPPHQAGKRLTVIKQPVGVVAAITPWNFPAAMITRKAAPALAVGCTVVLKPSELTPFSSLALAFLAQQAGIPRGAFNVITGDPSPLGDVLTSDPRVRKFTFTGSTGVGKLLAGRCMSTMKRLSLELGGNAPFIVFADADLDAAVEGAMASKFRNTGQTCICANRFLVQDELYDAFAQRLAARASILVADDGLERETQQGPLINAAALAKVERHVADALAKGARLLTGGGRAKPDGNFYRPTILLNVTSDMLLFREETFGPVAGLTRFGSEEEAVALANSTSAGLASYVYTRNSNRICRMSEELEYGMVGMNTGLTSTEVAPFGGVKESGIGREGSYYGADEYLDIKLICSDISGNGRAADT